MGACDQHRHLLTSSLGFIAAAIDYASVLRAVRQLLLAAALCLGASID